MIDYHVHPSYSADASGSIEEFCEAAVQKGLREICFTTHLDADPVREEDFVMVRGEKVSIYSPDWLEDYELSIRNAGDAFADQNLKVKLGVEVDLYPGVIDQLPETFHSTDFDLVVGSVHLVNHKAISLMEEAIDIFREYELSELGNRYYRVIIDSIESGLFDIVGHLDIYRRYGEEYYGEDILKLWEPHLEELVHSMKTHRVGFEVNTSSWRRGLKEPMPASSLIQALLKGGIDTVTVGSDAHRPEEVGSGIGRAISILMECGFQSTSLYDCRVPRPIRLY
ncbi:MAG: histidinol-phosphatase [Candidatus Thorarchaeota archaeon]|nr:MAG: histidinol-phosphatase [Candidatus Thorarchaeota archaeon]